jgi:hypothetical protein
MHIHKTGALIRAAVLLGAHCGEALTTDASDRSDHYANRIGLLFQVVDDILDAEASTATLGKTAGKDAANNKPTYVSLLGLERSPQLAGNCWKDAHHALEPFGEKPAPARTRRLHRRADLSDEPSACSTRSTSPADLRALGTRDPAPAGRRAARLPRRIGIEDRRPSVVQPRHGRADDRAALRLRHAGRPHGVGRRPPDLRAQGADRPPRGHGDAAHEGGVAGFPARCESEYDTFGVGHSSTSISAALGMAVAAARNKGEERHVVAVIGDGAMSAGMAFEALNNAGVDDANLLVILNDNDMSISPPVGALNKYLARLLSGGTYNAARRAGEKVLRAMPAALNSPTASRSTSRA